MAFAGTADRLERVSNIPRVLDYKTGKVEAKELKLKGDWTAELEGGPKGKALQLVVYATWCSQLWMKKPKLPGDRRHPLGPQRQAGLLSLNIDGESLIRPQHVDTFIHGSPTPWTGSPQMATCWSTLQTPNTANIAWSSTHLPRRPTDLSQLAFPGIVAKQSARNAVVLSTGLVLGAVNTMYVLPKAFDGFEEGWGCSAS